MFAAVEYVQGLCTVRTVCLTAIAEGTVGQYTIRPVLGEAKYQELKLMLEATGGSNKSHVYDFSSKSAAITVERRVGSSSSMSSVLSVSCVAGHGAYIEREMRL
ncbi:hypothetical protein M9H77_18655 [Catharanthus roseus]|uniref:Uncharacterized protein n=1 Tax=Catharanthus roseus TaxID=4058 RepID=A0ACC0B836_CATRO|nr:hypothetical protein M9H77_18655 [Catharanthus roseus]